MTMAASSNYHMKTHHVIILFFFICFHCNPATASPVPLPEKDDFSIGLELFRAGRFQQAYERLLIAFEQHPENPDVNFYLGRSAFEIGNYEMSVMAFERILIASPNEPRVKLEIARAFQKLGANDIARQYCREVLATNPPKAVKYNINRFLTYIDDSERKHFLEGRFILGLDWNDNVWASPATDTVDTIGGKIDLSGISSEKTKDWIYSGLLGIRHSYRSSNAHYSWKTEGLFYEAVYDKTGALDVQYLYGYTGPEYFRGKNRIDFRLFTDLLYLDGSQYQHSVGFKTTWDNTLRQDFLVSTALSCAIKDFPGSPSKDSTNSAISTDMHFLKHKNWYGIGFAVERELANDDELSYKRLVSVLSASCELPFNLTAFVNYEYEYSRYDEPAALFSEKRKDHKHYAGLALRKKLWQSSQNGSCVSLGFNYQHTWAHSNIELYEYSKNLFQSNLIYEF